MNISDEHAKKVCGFGKGAHTCSFLGMGSAGWECLKGTPAEDLIATRRAEGSMNAIGNNCSGPPDFTPNEEEILLN